MVAGQLVSEARGWPPACEVSPPPEDNDCELTPPLRNHTDLLLIESRQPQVKMSQTGFIVT